MWPVGYTSVSMPQNLDLRSTWCPPVVTESPETAQMAAHVAHGQLGAGAPAFCGRRLLYTSLTLLPDLDLRWTCAPAVAFGFLLFCWLNYIYTF